MESTHSAPEWITVSAVAAQLGVTSRTVRNMLADGRLQVRTMRFHQTANVRIHRADWENELKKHISAPVSA